MSSVSLLGVSRGLSMDDRHVCGYTADCALPLVCVDNRCMCSPLWGHIGASCNHVTWTSWALAPVLLLLSAASLNVLVMAAKKSSGFLKLAKLVYRPEGGSDAGSATMQAVIGAIALEISSHLWRTLTAIGVINDRTSHYWVARVFHPLEGSSYVLPAAIVTSVWMDLARPYASRRKSKIKIEETKRVLGLVTISHALILMVLSILDLTRTSMVLNILTAALAMFTCGVGAAKLCNALRSAGEASVKSAETVFAVSRAMGACFYGIFVGETLVMSSLTRKGRTANMALLGMTILFACKFMLKKIIFEYVYASAVAKRARVRARRMAKSVRSIAGSLRIMDLRRSLFTFNLNAPQPESDPSAGNCREVQLPKVVPASRRRISSEPEAASTDREQLEPPLDMHLPEPNSADQRLCTTPLGQRGNGTGVPDALIVGSCWNSITEGLFPYRRHRKQLRARHFDDTTNTYVQSAPGMPRTPRAASSASGNTTSIVHVAG